MPTKAEIAAVSDAVRGLERGSYKRDGISLEQAMDGTLNWSDLSQAERMTLLGSSISFEGFSADQAEDVMARVADREDPADWMDGVGEDVTLTAEQIEQMANEGICKTPEEHAKYLSDIAASYGMTVREMDDYWEKWGAHDDIPAPDEFKALAREMQDNASQRPLHEKGVRYEDHPDAARTSHDDVLREAASRGSGRAPERGHER